MMDRMTTVDGYAPGIPCWIDLATTDANAAAGFYADLFGWQTQAGGEDVGGYIMCELGGLPVAGIGQLPPDMPIPPAWTTYVSTADAEATVAAATANGGALMAGPMDITAGGAHLGRMAVLADPTGAAVGIWEADLHRGALRVNEDGTLTWNELLSRDAGTARDFFSELFGWGYQQIGDGESFDYTVIQVEDGNTDGVGGIMTMPAEVPPEVPSYWNIYFQVADADATVAQAVAAGATVVMPCTDTPQGRMASLADPQGAYFSIITPAG